MLYFKELEGQISGLGNWGWSDNLQLLNILG